MILVRCTDLDREMLASIKFDPKDLVDDGTNYRGKRVEKPWGSEMELYRDGHVCIWLLHIKRDQQTSLHCHPNKTTMLVVVGGEATVFTLNGTHALNQGDMMVIEKGAFHRTSSNVAGVNLYEIETPPNKRDLVRLEDKYGRGQGYEHVA